MTSIGELLPRAARLKYELEVQLRAVEAGAGDASDCSMGLQELQNQISTLRQLLDSERPERRALWKVKIDELGHEATFLAGDLRRVTQFHAHARERDQLFHRRGGAAPSAAADDLMEEGNSLARSSSQMDELMETGRASLDSLRQQRERLKNTHRNALTMINKLGLSNGLMKVMQTREKNDRVLLVVAVCFVLFVLYACVRYRRG
mmetsp:Transcript_10961/g.33846  ORF Transcript_10961/g.33846 Transcript_10961/m.33846 type:complete len:205 (+) Transcript_10961:200-814(+)